MQPPLHTEIKEGQWLGGAVTSQGEACFFVVLSSSRDEEIGQVGLRWKGRREEFCKKTGGRR